MTPLALCKFDEHMMSMVPTYKPMSEKELRESMYKKGAAEATFDQYLQCHNRAMEEIIQRGGVRVIGVRRHVVISLFSSQRIKYQYILL